MNEAKGLKIIHLNTRSLVSKIDQLRVWVAMHKPHIITLSETWLGSHISNSEINLTNYNLYRSDSVSMGGGVAIFISSDLTSELITPPGEAYLFECIFVKVTLHENKRLIIGSIYRPPSSPADSFNNIISTINSISQKNEWCATLVWCLCGNSSFLLA